MTRKQRREQKRRETAQTVELERELQEARARLRRAYDAFNLVSDPDLIDAWVFEINAQQARYSYLLKQHKAMEPEPAREDEVRT